MEPRLCGLDVARWGAEHSAIFHRELLDAFAPHSISTVADHPARTQHQALRFDQPKLLLKLEGLKRGDRSEVLMEGGGAHSRDFGKIVHPKWLSKILPNESDSTSNALRMAVPDAKNSDGASVPAGKQPEMQFPRELVSQDMVGQGDFRNILYPRFQGENLAKNEKLAAALAKVANRESLTAAQAAIAWVACRGADIVPLVGARTVERLGEALAPLTAF